AQSFLDGSGEISSFSWRKERSDRDAPTTLRKHQPVMELAAVAQLDVYPSRCERSHATAAVARDPVEMDIRRADLQDFPSSRRPYIAAIRNSNGDECRSAGEHDRPEHGFRDAIGGER